MRVQQIIATAILIAVPVWCAAAGPSVAPSGALPERTRFPQPERGPCLTCAHGTQGFSIMVRGAVPRLEPGEGGAPLWRVAATESQPSPGPAQPTPPEGAPSKPDESGPAPEVQPQEPSRKGYQSWAIGLELGDYAARIGRNPNDPNPQSEESGGISLGFYLELYPFRNLGFGYHAFSAFFDGPTVPTSYGEYVSSSLDVSASLLTMQWVVVGSDHPVRWVVIGGYGRGTISGQSVREAGTPVTHSGPVLLGGTFINFGGENIHFRLGMNRVDSHIHADDLAGTDGSSTYVYAAISVQALLFFLFHPY